MTVAMLLFLALQGMTESAYNAARARENPSISEASAVVDEAIRRENACMADESACGMGGVGDIVIVHVNDRRKSECVIESANRITCVRSTQLAADRFDFAPPHVVESVGAIPVAAVVGIERAWTGLPPLGGE